MTVTARTKVFRSGNSVAVRLPKSFGFVEGQDVIVVPHRDGSFTIMAEQDGAKALDALYGSFSRGFMSEGRGDTEQEERDWQASPRDRAA